MGRGNTNTAGRKTGPEKRRDGREVLAGLTVVAGCLLATGAMAGSANRTDAAAQSAQVRVEVAFAIPAQPLTGALTAFGRQSGYQVSVDHDSLAGIASPGVRGTMAPENALQALLAGTGVIWRPSDARSVILTRTPGDGADGLTLGPITVASRAEQATGPVDGYVATRSATGTKTDTPLLETPQSISVVTKDQMTAQGVQNVDQALRYTAGVVTETAGADNRFDVISGRGFDLDEYLDGTRLLFSSSGFAVPQVDPYALERVEVLRGPASVLYGQAGPGGIVNLVTKRPTETPLREVQVRTGSFAEKQGAFDLGGPVDDDGRFLYRFTGLAREAETQVDHTEYERYYIAPAVTWRPTDDTDLTVLVSHQSDPKAGFFNKLPAQGSALPNSAGQIPTEFYAGEPDFDKFDREMTTFGYAFEHRFSDAFAVRQNFRYLRMDSDFAAVFASGTLGSDGRSVNRQAFTSLEGLDAYNLDTQAEVRFATGPVDHTALIGLDYQHRRWDQVAGFGTAPPIDFLNPVYGQTITTPATFADQIQTQEQTGVYVQDQLKLANWSLLVGGRWDRAESETDNQRTGSTSEQTDDAVTGRIGLTYQFGFGLAPYASYAESFEPATGTSFGGDPFDPTTGQQYEIGLKFQPVGRNALFTLSAFDLTQQNVLTADPVNTGFSVQTGEIRSRGIEFEGKGELAENLTLTASYAYLDAEVTQANDGTEGNRPVAVPEHLASAWVDYAFHDGPLAGLGVGGGIRYRGSSFGDSSNTYKIDDATLFDAAIRYDLGEINPDLSRLEVAVNATNLFDKKYIGRCQDNGCYFGLRRTALATITYRW